MLFPCHEQMLPETSGIKQFFRLFEIIGFVNDEQKSDMWRIFGDCDFSNPEKLPRKTSLQRIYADWLGNGNPVGMGEGIMYMKKSFQVSY